MQKTKRACYGMVIDLDRCTGCGACAVACAVENNIPPARPETTERTGIAWMTVSRMVNGQPFPRQDAVFVPMACQHCGEDTPCVSVCPQNAVQVDAATGIVYQVPERCLGCRYCMAACPYHARYFNWWDSSWPSGAEKALNPAVSPRMRGVVEKCNFCHGRLHAARERAAAEGRRDLRPGEYVPACVEACPMAAIVFGDLADLATEASQLARSPDAFQFLPALKTGSKVYYRTRRPWVRQIAERATTRETIHG